VAEGCVLYARSSKDGRDNDDEAQRAELRAYAKQKGYRIVADYSEPKSVSANANPPRLADMLRELKNKARGWTVILAVDSSRIARDMNLAGVIGHEVQKAGCRIEYTKMSPSGNALMDTMVEAMARAFDQYHSMMSREKGLSGMRTNVEAGYRAGGRAPLGYEFEKVAIGAVDRDGRPVQKSRLIPDPVWAPRVKQYLQLRLRRLSRTVAARKSQPYRQAPHHPHRHRAQRAHLRGGDRLEPAREVAQERPPRPRAPARRVENQARHARAVHHRGGGRAADEGSGAEAREPEARPQRERFLLTGFLFTPRGERSCPSGDAYYRAGKGRRIPAAALETVVLDQANEDADSHEAIDRFIADARRAAAAIEDRPARLDADRRRVSKQIDNLLRVAERSPNSPTLAERLRELEAERAEIDAALAGV
jgi:site-specific DNA recombinase